jgi:actin
MDLESESFEEIDYTLPDGEIVKMGEELSMAPEILFCPNLIGKEEDGLGKKVKDYICGYEDTPSIIGSGGCIHLNGFISRLENEIEKKIIIPEESKYQEWKGASLLMKKGYIKSIIRSDYMPNEKFLIDFIPII